MKNSKFQAKLKFQSPTQKTRNAALPEALLEPAVCPKVWGAALSNAD
jgi:hypothetical protein